MILAFPPQETRKKFSVPVSFKRQQEVIALLHGGGRGGGVFLAHVEG